MPRPGCGGYLSEKRSRRGKIFFGCSNYAKTRRLRVLGSPVAQALPAVWRRLRGAEGVARGLRLRCLADGCGWTAEPDTRGGRAGCALTAKGVVAPARGNGGGGVHPPWACPAPAGPRDGQPTLPTPRASRAPSARRKKPYPTKTSPSVTIRRTGLGKNPPYFRCGGSIIWCIKITA